jgi:hypothetical protein
LKDRDSVDREEGDMRNGTQQMEIWASWRDPEFEYSCVASGGGELATKGCSDADRSIELRRRAHLAEAVSVRQS